MKKFYLLLSLIFMLSCNNEKTIYEGNYVTTYCIYYTNISKETKTICTQNEVYVCSFNGTNYLLEKNVPEELVSTTAPIRIIKTDKIK